MSLEDINNATPEEKEGASVNEEPAGHAVAENSTMDAGPEEIVEAVTIDDPDVRDDGRYTVEATVPSRYGPPRQKKRNIAAAFIIAAFVLGVSVASAAFYFLPIKASLADSWQGANATAVASAAAVTTPVGSTSIADIVDRTSPAVVLITSTVQSAGSTNPLQNDPFFRQFFGDRVPGGSRTATAMGSGFIISKDGYILTNEHVVDGATKIEVQLSGKDKPVPAKKVGSDFELDLAVLKVDGQNDLPTLQLGDSNSVRVGEWAIAIGNPEGLEHTVTVGVISAKGRPVTVQDRQYKNLLQTDASINPGNSGGPLLNMSGQVIGINTAVNASAQGIGFAIPTSTIQPVLDTLINQGKISRPWLGVYIQSMNQDIANYLKLDITEGALVTSVVDGGPAQGAGITQGDVITEIDHQKVASAGDLTDIVGKMKPNQKVVAVVYRDGKKMMVDIVIGEKGNVE